jgi:hypothetical protein
VGCAVSCAVCCAARSDDRLRGRLNEVFIGDLPKEQAVAYLTTHLGANAKDDNRLGADEAPVPAAAPAPAVKSQPAPAQAQSYAWWNIVGNLSKLTKFDSPRSAADNGNSSAAKPPIKSDSKAPAAAAVAAADSEDAVRLPERLAAAIDKVVGVLGGRMADLESLVERTRLGKSLNDAMKDMHAEARR